MRHLSVKISEHLYQQLETKAQEMGLFNISDAVRVLLRSAIEDSQTEANEVQKEILKHAVTTYYLVRGQTLGEKGLELNTFAHEKTTKLMERIFKTTDD